MCFQSLHLHAGARDAGSIASLQETICASKPEHYSHGGARPLLYASVLALSLQYQRLLQFLHKDRSAAALRGLAPALALALFSHGMLAAVEPPANRPRSLPGEAEGYQSEPIVFMTAAQVRFLLSCLRSSVLAHCRTAPPRSGACLALAEHARHG
jgi:hypothetical protein